MDDGDLNEAKNSMFPAYPNQPREVQLFSNHFGSITRLMPRVITIIPWQFVLLQETFLSTKTKRRTPVRNNCT